jgi:hypothetical protein
MSEILTIPAGVIMPKDLIMWLVKRRDTPDDDDGDLSDYSEGYADGRYEALQEVLLHVQHGPGK